MSYIYIYIYAVAHLLRSWVRIPPGAWIFVCCECRVLSGRGLCDELITRSEQSYRAWVFVCDPQNLKKRESKSELGCCDKEEFPTSHFLHTAVTPFPLTMDSQNATHMIAFPLNSVNKFVTDIRFRCDLQQQRCNFFHSQNNLTYSYRCNTHCLEYSQWQH